MTTSTTTAATAVATSTTGTAGSPSPLGGEGNVPPRVVRHRPTGRLVALVVAVCFAVAVAAATWISAHREAAPAAPVVGAAPAAVAVVGDASHGGPGSRADAVRFVPPRQDDRAVLAHGGSGRVVSGFGTSRAQLS